MFKEIYDLLTWTLQLHELVDLNMCDRELPSWIACILREIGSGV